jgi:signal transduction histidine kinase
VDQSSTERRQFKLKPYLEEILLSLSPTLKKTRHQVTIECADELSLHSYPGAYSQIITNLVMNSVTHGFEGIEAGHITITASEQAEGLLLRYSDNGKGIAAEHLDKIFDPFFTTRRGQGGSGLGMHIVYNLVTQTLGGTITCNSTPGQGVVFVIRIPIEQMEREIAVTSRPLKVANG